MGLLDSLGSSRPPRPGVDPVGAEALRLALVALNRASAPWQVRDGAVENTDLIAEWRILDVRWDEVFEKALVDRVSRLYLLIDETVKTVYAFDEPHDVDWSGGTPRLTLAPDGGRGQASPSASSSACFTEQGPGGPIGYRFVTDELRAPLGDCVTDRGWRFEGVLSRSSVTREKRPGEAAAMVVAAPVQVAPPVAGYSPPPAPLPPTGMEKRSNPIAVAGFVCGLLGLTPFWIGFVLCILAIVFGSVGLARSSRMEGAGRGLAIAGLVLGLVFLLPASCGI